MHLNYAKYNELSYVIRNVPVNFDSQIFGENPPKLKNKKQKFNKKKRVAFVHMRKPLMRM
jgi:hypothetical protein